MFKYLLKKLSVDRTLAILGIVIGIYGIILSLHANNLADKSASLQKQAEQSMLRSTVQKIAFNGPNGGLNILKSYSTDKTLELFNISFNDLNSQMNNEYLVSNTICYNSWKKFREFLIGIIQNPDIIDILSKDRISTDYYLKRDYLLNDCWEL